MRNLYLGLLLIPGLAFGATLTWNDVLNSAEKENTALVTARRDLEATELNEGVARKAYLPSLRANVSATRVGSRGAGGAVVSNGVVLNGSSNRTTDNYLAVLNLTQNLFNGLKDQAKIEQAQWRTKNKHWALVRTKSDVSFSLKEAFANLIYAQDYLKLTKDIIERRESNYKLVSLRYDNGRENKGSVLLSEANLEQAKLDAIVAQDALTVARRRLFSLLNRDDFPEYEAQGEVPMTSLNFSESEIQNLASMTPDYHQAFTLEKVAYEEISVARGNFFPTLDLSGNVTRQDVSFFPNNDRERWSVGLVLSIPLFDGFGDYSATKSAIASRYAAEGTRKTTYLNLIPQIKNALTVAQQSDIKLKVDTKFRNASMTRAEISRAKYNNGLLTFEDWDIIENDLISKQTSYLQSKRDRVIKYAAFEKTVGKGAIP